MRLMKRVVLTDASPARLVRAADVTRFSGRAKTVMMTVQLMINVWNCNDSVIAELCQLVLLKTTVELSLVFSPSFACMAGIVDVAYSTTPNSFHSQLSETVAEL